MSPRDEDLEDDNDLEDEDLDLDDDDQEDWDDQDEHDEDEEESRIMTTQPLKFSMTNDNIMVIGDDGVPVNVALGAPNYKVLRAALEARDWDAARAHLKPATSLAKWAEGRFTFNEGANELLFDGKKVPVSFARRVLTMVAKGETPRPLFRFYERLRKNPSHRSVEQLFDFLALCNIPIVADGCFLAYKGVNGDYTDCHSGKFTNKPGMIHEMPRNEISDDPREACHVGFHVGSYGYATGFGSRVVVCKVDPEHVVSVPYDQASQKMRVCRYAVVGHYGEPLPSTVMDEEIKVPVVKEGPEHEIPHTFDELMSMTTEELRGFAVNNMGIIGAGHIQGGKAVLVAHILKVYAGNGKKN